MIKFTCMKPHDRANKIMRGVQSLNYRANPYLNNFGVTVADEMITIPARILDPPEFTTTAPLVKPRLFRMVVPGTCVIAVLSTARLLHPGVFSSLPTSVTAMRAALNDLFVNSSLPVVTLVWRSSTSARRSATPTRAATFRAGIEGNLAGCR